MNQKKEKKNIFSKIIFNSYIKTFALMAIIVCALVAGLLLWLDSYTKHGEAVVVPNLRGMQVDEAANALKKENLKYEVIDSLFLTNGKAGAVVEQVPEENAKVKKDRVIYLTIQAKNVPMITIPNLKDLSQRQAVSTLRSLGFSNVTINEIPSVYKGLVIDVLHKNRSIATNEKLPKGDPITLTVGAGGETLLDSVVDYIPEQENNNLSHTEEQRNPVVDQSFFD